VANIGGISGPANGQITWSGYTWGVKDSGGAAVGPGPNVFVGSSNYVWTDGWGLHLNMQPQNGCNGWASSEIYNQQSLGYGEMGERKRGDHTIARIAALSPCIQAGHPICPLCHSWLSSQRVRVQARTCSPPSALSRTSTRKCECGRD
jgi:hypothetical protein